VTKSFCPHSAPNRNEYQVGFLGGKVRPARIADSSVVQVVPNVKVRMEVRHSVLSQSLHDLLRESFVLNCVASRDGVNFMKINACAG
jgi:hypothetical protein